MLRRLILLFVAFEAVSASILLSNLVPFPDGRIIGGTAANIEDLPYQISLRYFGEHRCGGSLIKANVVLSAAHCVSGVWSYFLSVVAGTSERYKGGVEVSVKTVVANQQYDARKVDFDLSLLILSKEFVLSEKIQTIALAYQDESVKDGALAHVSGWGAITEGTGGLNALQVVELFIINQQQCDDNYEGQISDQMICAGVPEGGKDACDGDSGGPLVVDGKLVGAVSFGFGCARPKYPGVYARIASMRDWIDKTLESY